MLNCFQAILLNGDISQLLLSMRCSRNILARASCESPLPPIFNVGSKQRAVRSDNIFATLTCSRSCKSTLNLGGRGFCFSVSCFFSLVVVAKGSVRAVAKYCRPTVGFTRLLLQLLMLLLLLLLLLLLKLLLVVPLLLHYYWYHCHYYCY